jgi:outer membrane protein OmpA-like peptidoglycan-associated protein
MRALILPTLAATLFGACGFPGAASLASDTSGADGRLQLAQLQPKDSKEEEARKKQQGGGRPQGEGRGQPPPNRGQPPQQGGGQTPPGRGSAQPGRDAPVQRSLRTQPGDAGPGPRGEPQIKRGDNPPVRQFEGQPKGGIQRGETPVQRPFQGQNPAARQDDGQPPKGAFQRGQNPGQRQQEGPSPSARGTPKEIERSPAKGFGQAPDGRGDARKSAEPQRPDDTRRFQGKDERPTPGVRPGFGGAPRVGDQGRPGDGRALRLEDMQKGRREHVEAGGQRRVIEEPDRRVIVRQGDRAIIQHDESARFRRFSRDARTERRNDGTFVTILNRRNGQVFSVVDSNGRLIRRYRRTREGREVTLIDNRRHYGVGRSVAIGIGLGLAVGLAAPRILIPREKYIVEYEGASYDDVYEALSAPPLEELDRDYSLEEIRYSPHLRDRMRRVDLDVINFEFGSWEIPPDQYGRLEWVANAINRILERNPDEVFLIEGHTDAVGSDEDNLSLSDRRAESVANVLSEQFEVPPENLVTQGYGEQYLKVQTDGPERINRRVAVRRITPLMQKHLSAR